MDQTPLHLPYSTEKNQSHTEGETENATSQKVSVFSGKTVTVQNPELIGPYLPIEILLEIMRRVRCYRTFCAFKCTNKTINQIITDYLKSKTPGLNVIDPSIYINNQIFYHYKIRSEEISHLGVELKNNSDYPLPPPKNTKILFAFSFLEINSEIDSNNTKSNIKLIGVLNDQNKSRFYLDIESTAMRNQELNDLSHLFIASVEPNCSGLIKYSPNWERLFNELQHSERCEIIDGIKNTNHFMTANWLTSSRDDEEELLLKIIILFENTTSRISRANRTLVE